MTVAEQKKQLEEEMQSIVKESHAVAGDVDDPLVAKAVDLKEYVHTQSMLAPTAKNHRLTFERLQLEQASWSQHNFGHLKSDYNAPFKGMVEELGELSHSLLKQEQGIRGTFEEHEKNAKDSIGDLLVFMADFCTRKGWSMQQIIEETWGEVKTRDWVKFPLNGRTE